MGPIRTSARRQNRNRKIEDEPDPTVYTTLALLFHARVAVGSAQMNMGFRS
jgi:hypothetical protein